MKSLRKVNFYVVILAMLFIGMLFWLAWGWGIWDALDWDFGMVWIWCPLLVVWLLGLWQLTMGLTKIENKSNMSIWVKPKKCTNVIEVKPGEIYYGAEGMRVYNTVFGLVDGAHIVIKENCDIRFKAFFSSAIAKVLPPDESWNSLFEIECQSFDIKQVGDREET